jgi:hypothetical protein
MHSELVAAGLEVGDPDEHPYQRWQAEAVGLDLLSSDASDDAPVTAVPVAAPYVRSGTTPPGGVTGPLIDLGTMPAGDLVAALGGGPGDAVPPPGLDAWLDSLPTGLDGAIALVHLDLPRPLTAEVFVALHSYLHWPGHTVDDWAAIDFRRLWLGPWPALAPLERLGLAGVVFSVEACADVVRGNGSPHTGRPQGLPAVVVDREVGIHLRAEAAEGAQAHLTLFAPTTAVTLRSLTAVLRGASDEVIIINSHTDGQNAFEENGAVALVALARHFASLPAEQRLRRTLVIAAWPGHMSGVDGLEEVSGWIDAHTDLVERAAAGVTIEHLGAQEWTESRGRYHPTGEPEVYGIWTTQGLTQQLTKGALIDADLHRHALLQPPLQITPGAPLHRCGVPHVSGIAGPTYLLVVSADGEMDKFDEDLAARQVAFYADVIRRLDAASFDDLRRGDATLGVS